MSTHLMMAAAGGRFCLRRLWLMNKGGAITTAASNRFTPAILETHMMQLPMTKCTSFQSFNTLNRDQYRPEFRNNDVYGVIYKKICKQINSEKTNFDDESLYSMSFQGTQGDQFNPFHKDCRVCFICCKKWDTWQQTILHILSKKKGDHRKKKPLHPNMIKALEKLELKIRPTKKSKAAAAKAAAAESSDTVASSPPDEATPPSNDASSSPDTATPSNDDATTSSLEAKATEGASSSG